MRLMNKIANVAFRIAMLVVHRPTIRILTDSAARAAIKVNSPLIALGHRSGVEDRDRSGVQPRKACEAIPEQRSRQDGKASDRSNGVSAVDMTTWIIRQAIHIPVTSGGSADALQDDEEEGYRERDIHCDGEAHGDTGGDDLADGIVREGFHQGDTDDGDQRNRCERDLEKPRPGEVVPRADQMQWPVGVASGQERGVAELCQHRTFSIHSFHALFDSSVDCVGDGAFELGPNVTL